MIEGWICIVSSVPFIVKYTCLKISILRDLSKLVLLMLINEHKYTGVQTFFKLQRTTLKFYVPFG
jgi:hypothetical protein